MPTPKTAADRTVAEFWRSYVAAGPGGVGYAARHPLHALRALLAIQRLRVVFPTGQSDTPGGEEVRRVLHQKGPLGLPARWWGYSAVPVIDTANSLDSPDAKRLRYNLRLAEEDGITCRTVPPNERSELLDMANHRERTHPDPAYRVEVPDNDDLFGHDFWMVAEDEAGQPLLLAVVAIDGDLAVLRYFRTLGDSETHTLSRSLAHQMIIVALADRDVKWLLDTNPPANQSNGVRTFQRIVGYRHVRIRRPRAQQPR
ncbi:MAG: hypothetical protein KDB71_02710 [Mycobacterium sp.]|nr:hypothetical protein [Mycobacterium sp.]